MTTPTSPTTSAYVTETIALLGDRDPLVVLAETPEWIRGRLAGLPAEALTRPEGPGKWSLVEVLAHLADAEVAFGWRARLLLTQDRPPLTGFDEGAWMIKFDCAHADPADALDAFASLRRWNLRVWRAATAEDLGRLGIHSERGPESFETVRKLIAGHDLRHRRQIDRILAGSR